MHKDLSVIPGGWVIKRYYIIRKLRHFSKQGLLNIVEYSNIQYTNLTEYIKCFFVFSTEVCHHCFFISVSMLKLNGDILFFSNKGLRCAAITKILLLCAYIIEPLCSMLSFSSSPVI
jgi:hypothetical protein